MSDSKFNPEHVAVVHTYGGDSRDERCDDVGSVEASAQPRLDDGNVRMLPGEPVERQRGSHLEERRPESLGVRSPSLDEGHDVLLRDELSIDAYALAEIDEMRRGVRRHP